MFNVPRKSLEIPGDSNPLIECDSFHEFSVNSFQETSVRIGEKENGPV